MREDIRLLLDKCRSVADFLEQRSSNPMNNTFRFAPEIREQGARLRLAVIELEKICGKM